MTVKNKNSDIDKENSDLINVRSFTPGYFSPGWDSIRYINDKIVFFNSKTGAHTLGEIDSSGNYSAE